MNPLFPPRLDNTYRGSKLALWLFGLVVVAKVAMSVNSMFNGYVVATRADGIPLDTFPPAAAQTVVAVFAIWGLAHLTICILCILALVRYRAMVPLMLALLTLEHLGRRVLLHFVPIERTGTPPGFAVNLILIGLMLAGLALSLRRQSGPPAQA